jgi:hypothetical protein
LAGLPEQPLRFVTSLQTRRHAAYLHKAKPKRRPKLDPNGVLVVTGAQPDRVHEFQAENSLAQPPIIKSEERFHRLACEAVTAEFGGEFQSAFVDGFRIGSKKPGTHQCPIKHAVQHGKLAGRLLYFCAGRY